MRRPASPPPTREPDLPPQAAGATVGAKRRRTRATRLGLVVALLLIVSAGAYSAFWFIVAGRLEAGLGEWAGSLRAHNLDLSWRAMRVGGFPLEFRVALSDARLRDTTASPNGELLVPQLSASALPWNFLLWHLLAPDGLSGTASLADGTAARLSARAADRKSVV